MLNFQKKAKAFGNEIINVEVFDSPQEVVHASCKRSVTDRSFHDFDNGYTPDKSWSGVGSFQEALDLMKFGYQPTVDKMKVGIKANLAGQSKRISFFNDVVGFAPVVPLALQGVPNCMQNSYMKPIKSKVLNVYYDMTVSCTISQDDIIKAGQQLLSAIMELEMQGYRFNLYAIQSYFAVGRGADVLCTRIKSSNTPIDLKKISFPLTHPAYFRVIGFDWYSKTPKGKYRSMYGHALGYDFGEEKMQSGFKEIFGESCVVFSAAKIIGNDKEHFKNVIVGKESA